MLNDITSYADFIKSQSKDKIFSHPDVQQSMLMMMGHDKNQKLELTKDEEKKIAHSYMKMFFALATIRWCRGETLGVARQKSLEQMNNYVKSKTNIAHPMNKYLMGINNQYHRDISQLNMTDSNSNEKLKMNPELKQRLIDGATKDFNESLKVLNDMYKKYMPEKDFKKMPATKSFDVAKQRAQMLMMQHIMNLRQNQRAA